MSTATNGLMTAKEAAAYLGYGECTVYRMASPNYQPEARRIRSYRLGERGGKLRFRREDLDQHLESCRAELVPAQSPKAAFRHLRLS